MTDPLRSIWELSGEIKVSAGVGLVVKTSHFSPNHNRVGIQGFGFALSSNSTLSPKPHRSHVIHPISLSKALNPKVPAAANMSGTC